MGFASLRYPIILLSLLLIKLNSLNDGSLSWDAGAAGVSLGRW